MPPVGQTVEASPAGPYRPAGVLAGMRIRKKLIFLHTLFSLLLVAMLTVALQPAVSRVVSQAETHEAQLAISLLQASVRASRGGTGANDPNVSVLPTNLPPGVTLLTGSNAEAVLTPGQIAAARDADLPSGVLTLTLADGSGGAATVDPFDGTLQVATVRLEAARQAVVHLYAVLILALLAVYGLIAAALEVFVLPRHVYGPIAQLLRADQAVLESRHSEEIIPDRAIPADELGEIMRSRNTTVRQMREHERALDHALVALEASAADLAKKNYLLEAAQRNLADADRLALLGTMAAGLAHEMNTPLAVVKGLTERLAAGTALDKAELELMLRVVGRLERLSDSLLDFARVRPPRLAQTNIAALVNEAWTLVLLDRTISGQVEFVNSLDERLVVPCDSDRMLQVFVNLLRNAADAMLEAPGANGRRCVTVTAEHQARDGRTWTSILIADEGPGLDPSILGKLFEPFATTRLDANGTGLGLAVSEGIVREHGGLLLARNRPNHAGAVLEITLPG